MSKQFKIVRGQWCTHPHGPQMPHPPYPDKPEKPEIDDEALKAYIEELIGEDGAIFFPRTHIDAVIDSHSNTLTLKLAKLDERIADCESKFDPNNPPVIRVYDSLKADSKSAALSANKGKWLYDTVINSDLLEYITETDEDGKETTKLALKDNVLVAGLTNEFITGNLLAAKSISFDKLDNSLQASINSIDTFLAWRNDIDKKLDEMSARITSVERQYDTIEQKVDTVFSLWHSRKTFNVKLCKPGTDEEMTRITSADLTSNGFRVDVKWEFYNKFGDVKDTSDCVITNGIIKISPAVTIKRVDNLTMTDPYKFTDDDKVLQLGLDNVTGATVLQIMVEITYGWKTWSDTKTIQIRL